MSVPPPELFTRAVAAADAEGRLPVPDQVQWETFPFESGSLFVKPLEPPVLPEPPRGGEGGAPCLRCERPEEGVAWSDERWVLAGLGDPGGLPLLAVLMPRDHVDLEALDDELAADLGLLMVQVSRAVQALRGIGRVHVCKWGDGLAHLHVFFMARPAGMLQLRGSNLALWEEMLPRVPQAELDADLLAVAELLAAARGGRVHEPPAH